MCSEVPTARWSPDAVSLIHDAAVIRANRFTKAEYDLNTWATRTWLTFVTQRVSVVLHKAVAAEVRAGCRVGAAESCDVRGKWVESEVGGGVWGAGE